MPATGHDLNKRPRNRRRRSNISAPTRQCAIVDYATIKMISSSNLHKLARQCDCRRNDAVACSPTFDSAVVDQSTYVLISACELNIVLIGTKWYDVALPRPIVAPANDRVITHNTTYVITISRNGNKRQAWARQRWNNRLTMIVFTPTSHDAIACQSTRRFIAANDLNICQRRSQGGYV
jgi:hypothetical protein